MSKIILVVDDEPVVLNFALASLRSAGYTVLTASGAGEALAAYDSFGAPIDLLLTDVVMPGMSGPRLVEQLSRRQPGLRFVYVTAHIHPLLNGRLWCSPEDQVLVKPFSWRALAEQVEKSLGVASHVALPESDPSG